MKLLSILALPLVLGGCGYIGPVLPPTLDIPSDVSDLRAIEYGDEILVDFTIPALTTEGLMLDSVHSVELAIGACGAPRPDLCPGAPHTVPVTKPGPVEHQLPAREFVGKNIVLAVRATGPKGKTSNWSNLVQLSVGPPLPQPTVVQAKNQKEGVGLSWRSATSSSATRYRVLRSVADGQPETLGETDKAEYLDDKAQDGTHYRYMVMALASETYMSVVSDPPVEITPVDEFAPEVPAGVTAVAGVNTIEVAWDRNTEADFKGYNVYRSVDGGPFVKIANLIEVPTFSDKVEPGKNYRYEISAEDLIGNESVHSEPKAAALP